MINSLLRNRTVIVDNPDVRSHSRLHGFWLVPAVITFIVLVLPGSALAQWTTSGNDIRNNNSGNVGVGTATTAPADTLTVGVKTTDAFGVRIGGGGQFGGTATNAGINIRPDATKNGFLSFTENTVGDRWVVGIKPANGSLFFSSGGNSFATAIDKIVFSSGGFVGIGTTSPTNALVIGADIGALQNPANSVVIANTSDNSLLTIGQSSVTRLRIKWNYNATTNSAYSIIGNQNLNNSLVLQDQGGKVGIGTVTPGYTLDVVGQVRSSSGGFVFPDGTVQATAATGIGTITGVTAGAGLSGGGSSGAVTLNVGAGTGVTVAADSIAVNYGSTAGTAVQGNTSITVSAGSGMSGGGALTLGSGGSLTLTNDDRGSSQSIFKNVANAAGATQFSAGSNADSILFQGNGGTTVSFDAATKKVIIDASTSTGTAANIAAGQFGQNTGGGNYIFPNNVTVNGNIAARYQDVAEWVDSTQTLTPGTVVVLDSARSNHVVAATHSYDSRVAGVISLQPGLVLGAEGNGRVLVATSGRVKVKVDAGSQPIQIGDLLVTGEKEGFAMKSMAVEIGGISIHRPGTLLGKALEPLAQGTGEILVLLSLQ